MLKHKIRRSTLAVTGRFSQLMQLLLRDEAVSGKFLIAAAVVALIITNSSWREAYEGFWQHHFYIGLGDWGISETFKHWIDEGLMSIFFLVVGLEVKREIIRGELQTLRAASLPIMAAVGGMIIPIAIYMIANAGGAGFHGWGIPMTTDTALALGVLALLGDRVPSTLKIFLLAVMVADDIGAIATIAVFYNHDIQLMPLLIAAGVLLVILVAQWVKMLRLTTFVILGVCLWLAVHASGVHASIAGAILGLAAPIVPRTRKITRKAIAERLERSLIPVTTFVIIPLFALANTGVVLNMGVFEDNDAARVGAGIIGGLVLGKVVGILLGSWVAVKLLGITPLPRDVRWGHILGGGLLAGIGFTLSIFIAELSFGSSEYIDAAKISIFGASIISALVGMFVLWRQPRHHERAQKSLAQVMEES
jgi:NhaA family Na+:H+ antiporter